MELEELSSEEINLIERDIFSKLLSARGKITGISFQDYITVNSTNSSVDIIKNFRTLGLTSYNKEAYDREIPDFMKPLKR